MELPPCKSSVASELLGADISLSPISIHKLTPSEWTDTSCSGFQRRPELVKLEKWTASSGRRGNFSRDLKNAESKKMNKTEAEKKKVYKEGKEGLTPGRKRDPGREREKEVRKGETHSSSITLSSFLKISSKCDSMYNHNMKYLTFMEYWLYARHFILFH